MIKKITPPFFLSWYHLGWALFGACRFGFPSRRLTVIGVTGTNGKSSVAGLLTKILEDGGYRVAASSSIEFQVGEKRWTNMSKMTMPGRFFLQRLFYDAVRSGCTYAVVEVTSEGIRQHRHRFVEWDVAVFTNLSPEHIERHGSIEKYRQAKGELFHALRRSRKKETTAIVNLEDKEASFFTKFGADRTFGFRRAEQGSKMTFPNGGEEFVAENSTAGEGGVQFSLRGIQFTSPLLGTVSIQNILAAVTTAYACNISLQSSASTIRRTSAIPGRLEEIDNNRGIRIFVDYAHTPEALRAAYEAIAPLGTPRTCILGAAGGGRDQWKRPLLGGIAAEFCDRIIVTDEDPYDEDPAVIRRAVAEGMMQARVGDRVDDIADRREAIGAGIAATPTGGVLVITGKGCEPWMAVAKGKKLPWDDRAVVHEELQSLKHKT